MKKKFSMVSVAAALGAALIPLAVSAQLIMPGYDQADSSLGATGTPLTGLQVPTDFLQTPTTEQSSEMVSEFLYPDGPRLIALEGTMTAYWVSERNVKIPMLTTAVFESYGNSWEDVEMVSREELDYYANAKFIRLSGSSAIYKVSGKTKRLISSAAWNASGADANLIIDVNKTDLNSYKTGSKITQAAEVNK